MDRLASNHHQTFSIAKQMQDKLNVCFQSAADESGVLSTTNLLGCFYIQINICRALLRCHVANARPTVQSSESMEEFVRYAREVTEQSVTNALAFARNLDSSAEVLFWPAWSPTAFTSFVNLSWLMLVTSIDSEEAKGWMKTLTDTRSELRSKSKQLPVLRLSLLRIDAIIWKGIKKTFALEKHVSDVVFEEIIND